jgi:hypothetical protein
MANKTDLKKEGIDKSKPTEKKQKKAVKKSTGIVPSSVGSSAVYAVKARSSRDVRGGSGLANTGTIISYD